MTKVLIVDEKGIFTGEHKQKFLEKGLYISGIIQSKELSTQTIQNTQTNVILLFSLKEEDLETTFHRIYKNKTPTIVIAEVAFNKKIFQYLKENVIDFISIHKYDNIKAYYAPLYEKLETASKAKIITQEKKPVQKQPKSFGKIHYSRKKIVVVASSTGGPQTLERFLTDLPANIPVPILIVQHMPEGFTKPFAERLNKVCNIEVMEAIEGQDLKNGVAYIAPAGRHMELFAEVEGFEGNVRFNDNQKENGVRPAADVLFRSVAPIFKENTIGIVLTGMGKDGCEGAKKIKEVRGTILAQSEKTCVIYGMPKAVVDENLADEVLDIENMAVGLLQLIEI